MHEMFRCTPIITVSEVLPVTRADLQAKDVSAAKRPSISCASTREKLSVEPDGLVGSARLQATVAIGQQPRGKRAPNMLSEFAYLEWVRARDLPQLDKKACTMAQVGNVAKGAKFVSFVIGERAFPASDLKHSELDEELADESPLFAKFLRAVARRAVAQEPDQEEGLVHHARLLLALGVYRTPQ